MHSGLESFYYSVLHGKRTLLLMDNAADDRQVERLIPPKSCLLIFTSRKLFNLPGLFSKSLDKLSPTDACNFLLKIAPRIGNCVDEIAKHCGYLPLALRLAANILATGTLSPEDYLKRLAENKERLELIDASISLSYELLDEEEQKLWRQLATFKETFTLDGASDLWKLDKKMTQKKLDKFYSSSLIEWNANDEQYHLHDLVRVFADEKMSSDDHYTEQQRFVDYKNRPFVMENLSKAFVQSIASVAGVSLKFGDFDYGIDGTFHQIKILRGKTIYSGFPLDFVLQATTNWKVSETSINLPLTAKTYNRLVVRNNSNKTIPIILILLCYPNDYKDWITYTEGQATLRIRCYWDVLRGNMTNLADLMIRIPRSQQFTPYSLNDLLVRLESGHFWESDA